MVINSRDFGRTLKSLRLNRGLSQFDLATAADVSTRHLSFLETGRAQPSERMVDRLASALALGPIETDEMRIAAGRCPQGLAGPTIGAQVFESALTMDHAASARQIIDAARAPLSDLGVAHFFFGTLHHDTRPLFDWANFDAFPTPWLLAYDREGYARTDPLLVAVQSTSKAFFWDDVIDRRSLTQPARAMFDGVAQFGIQSGFVVSRPQPGATQLVSMMGAGIDSGSRAVRLALDIIGSRMLANLARLGVLPTVVR